MTLYNFVVLFVAAYAITTPTQSTPSVCVVTSKHPDVYTNCIVTVSTSESLFSTLRAPTLSKPMMTSCTLRTEGSCTGHSQAWHVHKASAETMVDSLEHRWATLVPKNKQK